MAFGARKGQRVLRGRSVERPYPRSLRRRQLWKYQVAGRRRRGRPWRRRCRDRGPTRRERSRGLWSNPGRGALRLVEEAVDLALNAPAEHEGVLSTPTGGRRYGFGE